MGTPLLMGAGSYSSPNITVSTGSLSFGSVQQDAYSTSQNYTVSGIDLSANIVVTAPANFIINTDNSNTQMSPITLVQIGGTVIATTIYVKFLPTALISYSANITHTSTGATTQNVAVTGTGAATLVLDVTPSTRPCYSFSRKLRTAYTGPLFKMRRDSDNTTIDIYPLNNVTDEASMTAFLVVAGGYVDTLYDQNTSVNLTNADANLLKQPTLAIAGVVNKMNGLIAARWTSSPHQYLKGSSAADWAFLNNTSGFQIYLTMSKTSAANTIMGTNTIGTSAVVGYFLDIPTAGNLRSLISNGATVVVNNTTTGAPAPDTTLYLYTEIGDPGNGTASLRDSIQIDTGTVYTNNVATAAASASNPANPLELGGTGGGSGSFVGNICELLFY